MDLGILVGTLAGLAVLYHAVGGSTAFCDVTGLLVVVIGGLAATLAAFPAGDVLSLWRAKHAALFRRRPDPRQLIRRIVGLAETARREGILTLEKALTPADDPWLQAATRLAVDGTEPRLIRDIMSTELDGIEARHRYHHRIFGFMGRSFVLFGVLGGLIALAVGVHGGAPASAWLPRTVSPLVFGGLLAGLGVWPLQRKLATATAFETMCKRLMLDGVGHIQSGDNPRIIEHKLSIFLAPRQRPTLQDPIEPATPPRPAADPDDSAGEQQLSAYLADHRDAIVRQARAAVEEAPVDAPARDQVLALADRCGRGEVAPELLLARLGTPLRERVFHGLAHPQEPLLEDASGDDVTFEGLVRLSDHEVQLLLRETDQRDLVTALGGASPALRAKLLANMSERVRFFLLQEMSYRGFDAPTILEAQVRILARCRRLQAAGQVG